ncbi:hypothetical protein SBV1_2740002 [Verrucomicrobia bacterium]|nr:hypothetical protein SBV1_2740002 [Verrucomicrobiota bacterium]
MRLRTTQTGEKREASNGTQTSTSVPFGLSISRDANTAC